MIHLNKYFILFTLSLVWGSSFILMKYGLKELSPLQLGSIRILSASLFTLIIGFKSLKKLTLYHWKYLLLVSLLSTLLPIYLFAFAQTSISSSTSSIINSLTPINTLIISVLFFNSLINKKQIFGILLSFIGSVLLIIENYYYTSSDNNLYSLLVIICTICYGFGINIISIKLTDLKPISIATGSFILALIPAIIILFKTNYFNQIDNSLINNSFLSVILLGILGTGLANIAFFKLIKISSSIFASSVTYLVPVVAIIWGLIDGESVGTIKYLGGFIILCGIYLSSKKNN